MKKYSILLLFIFVGLCQTKSYSQCNAADFAALHYLYNSTNGSTWANNAGWSLVAASPTLPGGSCDLSTLAGVDTDVTGRVTSINLDNNNLTGVLPSQIGNLSEMITFNIGNSTVAGTPNPNSVNGSIPVSIDGCSNLENLLLQGNDLSGSIPTEITTITTLRIVNLASNAFTGGIPTSIGNLINLRSLTLGYNSTLGGSIPNGLGNCPNLTTLNLEACGLNGPLPSDIGNCMLLKVFWIRNNLNLNGSIPSSYDNLVELTSVRFTNNSLSGPIPTFPNSLDLEILALSLNQFTGSLPTVYGSFLSLIELGVAHNQLTGSIPSSWDNLTLMRNFSIGDNLNIVGNLRPAFSNFTDMISFNVQNNPSLNGTLPPGYSNWTGCRSFRAGGCDFTGQVPVSYGNWTQCILFDIGENSLNGPAPDIFTNMLSLNHCSFDNNNFSGNMPVSLAQSTNLEQLFIEENNMSGCFDSALVGLCTSLTTYQIDNGNSFNSSWSNFCSSGAGECVNITPTECVFNNGLPINLEVDGNSCVKGMMNVTEAIHLTPLLAEPTNVEPGTIYFDANTAKLRVWDGTVWRECW